MILEVSTVLSLTSTTCSPAPSHTNAGEKEIVHDESQSISSKLQTIDGVSMQINLSVNKQCVVKINRAWLGRKGEGTSNSVQKLQSGVGHKVLVCCPGRDLSACMSNSWQP